MQRYELFFIPANILRTFFEKNKKFSHSLTIQMPYTLLYIERKRKKGTGIAVSSHHLRLQVLKLMSLMVTFVAHPQPSHVPPARGREHLPQSRRPDNKSLVLQNKSHLSNNKWLLFSIKRQLFCKILLS